MTTRVLIADDNEIMRRLIRTFLEQVPGVEICAQTTNGIETVDTALALRPDLLVLDFMMPGLNGIEVAGVLKKSLPEAKSVLFTMYSDSLHERLAAAAGITTVLAKTGGISALTTAVRSMVAGDIAPASPPSESGPPHDLPNEALQADLLEKAEQFSSTFEQNAVGLAHMDKDGRFLRVNGKFSEILGYSRQEMQTLSMLDISHPAGAFATLELPRIAAGEIDCCTSNTCYVRRNGQIARVRFSLEAVRDAERRLKYSVCILEDLSVLNDVHARLSEAIIAGQTSAGHLELLTRRYRAPLTRCSRDLKYLWVNQYYADWLQRPMDKIVGRPIVDVVGKAAFQRLEGYFGHALAGRDVDYEAEAEYDVIGLRRISASYKPALGTDGTPEGWFAFVQDITPKEDENSRSEEPADLVQDTALQPSRSNDLD